MEIIIDLPFGFLINNIISSVSQCDVLTVLQCLQCNSMITCRECFCIYIHVYQQNDSNIFIFFNLKVFIKE